MVLFSSWLCLLWYDTTATDDEFSLAFDDFSMFWSAEPETVAPPEVVSTGTPTRRLKQEQNKRMPIKISTTRTSEWTTTSCGKKNQLVKYAKLSGKNTHIFGSKINEFERKKSEMNEKITKTQKLQAILVESGLQSDNRESSPYTKWSVNST